MLDKCLQMYKILSNDNLNDTLVFNFISSFNIY